MNGKPIAVAVLMMISAMAGCMGHEHDDDAHDFNGMEYNPASPAADFTLTDQNGQSVSLSDYHGKVVVMAFTYTSCPDVCLAIEANLNYIEGEMSDESDLVVLSITIDPARDTPEHLLEWTEDRGYTWPHLTSDNLEDFENDDKTGVWDQYHLLVDNDHIYSDHSDHGNQSEMSHQVAVLYPDNTTALLDGDHDLLPEENATGWNLTEPTMAMNNVSLDYTEHPTYGHSPKGINGTVAPEWDANSSNNWYWALYIWNETNSSWDYSNVGIDDVMVMQDTDHVAWAASNANLSYLPTPGSDMVCYNMGTHALTNHTQQINCEEAGYMWVENQQPSEHGSHDDHGEMHGEEEMYEVGHNTVAFIIDKDGNKRLVYTGSDWSTADFMEDLEHLLHHDSGAESEGDEHSGHDHH